MAFKNNTRSAMLSTAAAIALLGMGSAANAESFSVGEVDVVIDTTLSYGVSVRTQDRDCKNIAAANGGCFWGPRLPDFGFNITGTDPFGTPVISPAFGVSTARPGGLRSGKRGINSDNGNLNFDQGSLVGSAFKVTSDFQAQWRNWTLFLRGSAFLDTVYMANDMSFRDVRSPAKDDLQGGFDLLDAYINYNFDVADIPVTLRVGNQVVNWGESLLIRGGINSYIPVDVARLRTPGSEVKEGLLPTPSVFTQIGIFPGVDFSAFYQWKHVDTEVDPAGSFFSTADVAGAGNYRGILGSPDDPALAPITQGRFSDDVQGDNAWGVNLTYFADWLNGGTELQFYYVNYTSTLPYFTRSAPTTSFENACNAIFGPGGYQNACANPDPAVGINAAAAGFVVSANSGGFGYLFPDDVETFGFSFNTLIGSTAVSGEVAYFPDLPMNISDVEQAGYLIDGAASTLGEPFDSIARANFCTAFILDAYSNLAGASTADIPIALGAPGIPVGDVNALQAAFAAAGTFCGNDFSNTDRGVLGAGDKAPSIHREDAITGQIGTITTFAGADQIAQLLGSDQVVLVGNLGFMWVPDLPEQNKIPLAGGGCALGNPQLQTAIIIGSVAEDTTDRCPDEFSMGARAILSAQYNNAFGTSWTVTPTASVRWDITGISPGPIGPGFVDGVGSFSVGLRGDYLSKWRWSLEYTDFYGGGLNQTSNDRDFASFSLSYSF